MLIRRSFHHERGDSIKPITANTPPPARFIKRRDLLPRDSSRGDEPEDVTASSISGFDISQVYHLFVTLCTDKRKRPTNVSHFLWYTRHDIAPLLRLLEKKIPAVPSFLRGATPNMRLVARQAGESHTQVASGEDQVKTSSIATRFYLVHPARFERATSCSASKRSIQLSYGCISATPI